MKYILLAIVFASSQALAGFVEVGASMNLRENSIDNDNKTITRSLTGSLAYYFLENSAIEFSYTEGYVKTNGITSIGGVATTYEQLVNFKMYGADLIFSMGSRNDIFQPYVKAGMAMQEKEIQFKSNNSEVIPLESDGEYLTGGVGFKFLIGKNWALKAGYDIWKGPLGEEEQTTDSAVRAGISFIF